LNKRSRSNNSFIGFWLLDLIVVDTFLVYSLLVKDETEYDVSVILAEELSDSSYNSVAKQRPAEAIFSHEAIGRDGQPR
jgi:hypothetical protein